MTTDEQVASAVRDARASGTALRIIAGGTWMDAGRPSHHPGTVSVAAMRGLLRYEPGDLTLTARAGTTLAELRDATAANRQWIPLDPFGTDDGTIGATVATASAGPLATGFGTPRDQVLGCTFITGTGEVVAAGGRVVKNVAGFDLTRLMIGAWGTLGAITEVSLRVRAAPEVDSTMLVQLDGPDSPSRAWRWLRESEYRPMAAELLSPAAARASFGVATAALAVRVGGSAALVSAARAALGALGSVADGDDGGWRALRAMDPPASATLRLSTRPSRSAEVWASATPIAEAAGGWTTTSLARGIIRCVVPAGGTLDDAITRLLALRSAGITCIVERAPASTWAALRSPVGDELSRRVRDAFDPARVLNRGILGEPS